MSKKYFIDIHFFQGQGFGGKRFPLLEWVINNEGRKATLREIGEEVGMSSPQKVKHYLLQMMDWGMIYKDGGKGYKLTPKLRECFICGNYKPNLKK